MVERHFMLNEVEEVQLDSVLSLNDAGKTVFFDKLIKQYYPHALEDSELYSTLQIQYRSCWMTEKIYRNNVFFKECFSVVYTKTGLIRDIINDMYFTSDNLIIH
jgi:hypothetical protein